MKDTQTVTYHRYSLSVRCCYKNRLFLSLNHFCLDVTYWFLTLSFEIANEIKEKFCSSLIYFVFFCWFFTLSSKILHWSEVQKHLMLVLIFVCSLFLRVFNLFLMTDRIAIFRRNRKCENYISDIKKILFVPIFG